MSEKIIDDLAVIYDQKKIHSIRLMPNSTNSEALFRELNEEELHLLIHKIHNFVDNPIYNEIWSDGDPDEPSNIIYVMLDNGLKCTSNLKDLVPAIHRAFKNEVKLYQIDIECYI